jgi:asparagine N-glycosylation enzyme membrane subunit Stt3
MIQEYLSDVFNTWDTTGHAEVQKTILGGAGQRVRLGEILGFEYIIGDATNAITMTFNLYDHHGVLVHTKAAIAKNGTTVERMKYVTTGTNIPLFGEGFKIGFDPSGDSGDVPITGRVRIYYET